MKKYVSLLLVFAMIFSGTVSIFAQSSRDETEEMLEYIMAKIDEENAELWEAQKPERAKEILENAIAEQSDLNKEEITAVKNETIVFDDELYEGKTAEEITKAKLMFCGFSEDIAEGIMSEDMIEIMSGETEAVKQTIYMKEVVTDDECELVCITEEERNARIAVTADTDESEEESVGGETTVTIDGGTLKMQLLCAWTKADTSHIVVAGSFAWETMPAYRGQDFFGITKDIYTTIDVNSYISFWRHIHTPYSLINPAGTVIFSWLDSSNVAETKITDVAGDPGNGMVMSVPVPDDFHPLSPIPGAAAYGYENTHLNGACSFTVDMAQPSVTPTNYLLWVTYCHQKSSYIGSISIGLPLSASITVEPQAKYEKATYALNMTYNKN